MSERETYLGDGLYASFNGWMVTLRAPREDGDHWVGLELPVLDAFLTYVARLPSRSAPKGSDESPTPDTGT